MILASNSFLVQSRADLIQGLKNLIVKHLGSLLNSSPLIKCRLMLLSSFLLDSLIKVQLPVESLRLILELLASGLSPRLD